MTKTNNTILAAAAATAAAMLWASVASAVIYEDTNGTPGDPTANDLGTTFDGFDHLDIDKIEVTNTTSDLSIAITLVGDAQVTNWGKYCVGFDIAPGGDTAVNGNAWGRSISISSGMDTWIGSWVDGSTGLQVWRYTTSWGQTAFTTPTVAANVVTLTASLSSLGLSDGTTFQFDVYTTGGTTNDGPVDAAGNPAQTIAGWSDPYDSVPNLLSYTVTGAVPPSTWNVPGGGNWNDAGNWTVAGVPNGIGVEAILGSAIAANSTVATTSGVTLGTLTINNGSASYEIGGTGSLTMQSGGIANLNVEAGAHAIGVPLNIVSNTRLDVFGGATLDVGTLHMSAGQRITKFGGGTLNLNGAMMNEANSSIAIDVGTVNLANDLGAGLTDPIQRPDLYVSTPDGGPGAEVNFATSQSLNQFGVNPNGTANLAAGGDKMIVARNMFVDGRLAMNDNDFIVDYSPTEGGSPEIALRDKVKAFIDAPGTMAEITFTTGAGDVALAVAEQSEWGQSTFNGVALDGTAVIGKYTYYGDANLDGAVTSDDYVAVDVGLGTGDSWVQGDFNFSGTVTSDDYVAIDVNLGKGTPTPLAWAELKAEMIALHTEMFGDEYVQKLALAEAEGYAALVPEPGALSLVCLGALGVLGRRRRR